MGVFDLTSHAGSDTHTAPPVLGSTGFSHFPGAQALGFGALSSCILHTAMGAPRACRVSSGPSADVLRAVGGVLPRKHSPTEQLVLPRTVTGMGSTRKLLQQSFSREGKTHHS